MLDMTWCAPPDVARPEWALNETAVEGTAGTLRLRTDGSLDLKDTYSGGLLGYKGPTSQILVKDGRKVLGIHLRQGAILDGLALVAEKK